MRPYLTKTASVAQVHHKSQHPLTISHDTRQVQHVVEIDVLFVQPVVANRAIGSRVTELRHIADGSRADGNSERPGCTFAIHDREGVHNVARKAAVVGIGIESARDRITFGIEPVEPLDLLSPKQGISLHKE